MTVRGRSCRFLFIVRLTSTTCGRVLDSRIAVAGTGVLTFSGLITEKGLSPGGQSKIKSAGLAGLDSETVRRWVAEAARSVRQIPPAVVVPSSSQHQLFQQQQQQQQQHQQQQHQQSLQSARRPSSDASPSSLGPFVLPTSMTQTPSMHLLENNNLMEVAIAQQHQAQQQAAQQKHQGKQTSSPTNNNNNNNNIDAWRLIQSGHQWWSPPSSVHQDQEMSPISQPSQVQSIIPSQVQRLQAQVQAQTAQQQSQTQQQQQPAQSDVDQPLDFSVGSMQQQRLHSRVQTIHDRLQGKMHDNNNTTGAAVKIVNSARRSNSPSEASTSASEDEGVSTGGSPSGPLRGAENDHPPSYQVKLLAEAKLASPFLLWILISSSTFPLTYICVPETFVSCVLLSIWAPEVAPGIRQPFSLVPWYRRVLHNPYPTNHRDTRPTFLFTLSLNIQDVEHVGCRAHYLYTLLIRSSLPLAFQYQSQVRASLMRRENKRLRGQESWKHLRTRFGNHLIIVTC
ncbi:hypothetical protein KQX54_021879 [Cotesia glomerata]|uniref:Uncharacterized protein n=1 Tax=Cotesia glomerata TaxID=32391 RepID=A0AAV7JAK1_COTGL|nr:hypothetical protein KQX54_021879 [Cotesia glomerata]